MAFRCSVTPSQKASEKLRAVPSPPERKAVRRNKAQANEFDSSRKPTNASIKPITVSLSRRPQFLEACIEDDKISAIEIFNTAHKVNASRILPSGFHFKGLWSDAIVGARLLFARIKTPSRSCSVSTLAAATLGRLPVRRPSMFKRMSIDAHRIWSILVIPHEAGLLYLGVRSTYILGLQIGLNFVPATKTET